MEVLEATTDDQILACFPAIRALKPEKIHQDFLGQIRKQQKEGYHLMYIKNTSDEEQVKGKVSTILGYHTTNQVFKGKTFYVDEFSTLPEARGKGQGGALLDWVMTYTKNNGYNTISLDSTYPRSDAHRLYLNKGFIMRAHLFEIVNIQGSAWLTFDPDKIIQSD